MTKPRHPLHRATPFSFLFMSVAALACAPIKPPEVAARPPTGALHAMPSELGLARSPDAVDPNNAAELAEASLHLLDPERTGGPDYAGAARMCLMAVDVAVEGIESDLRSGCLRVAARSALRSGDTGLYLESVDRWDALATNVERSAGEFLVHAAIRDRLRGKPEIPLVADPMLRRVLDSKPASNKGQSR